MDKLRLHLKGDPELVTKLYEALFLHCLGVEYRLLAGNSSIGSCTFTPGECLSPVGLEMSQGLVPYPGQVFPGFRQLIELLSFPAKYWFVDLAGWDRLRDAVPDARGTDVEVILYFSVSQDSLERSLSEENLVLDCAPLSMRSRKPPSRLSFITGSTATG